MWNRLTRFLNEQFFRMVSFFLPPRARQLPLKPRLILVFSTTGIGDCLFDSVAIKSLKQGYPEARLVVCAHHRRPMLAEHNPFIDEVIRLSKSPLSQLRLLARFWKKRPDLVVALRVNEDVVPLGYLLNRHAFVGSIERCQRLAFLLSHPVIAVELREKGEKQHILNEMLRVALAAGGASTTCSMVYQIKDEERRSFFAKHPFLLEKKYIVFQTGGGRALSWRNWPPASYIQAIQWVQQHYNYTIILTGGRENREVAQAIEKACPGVVNYAEKTTLEETAVLLSRASMLVSSDTGVMHLAFAIQCPTLSILHHRSPSSFCGPLKDYLGKHKAVELEEAERATLDPAVDEMAMIPFERVQAAIKSLLEHEE